MPLAREAIGRGLAVVVDKPLAVRGEDARELVAVAREAGSRLTTFQNRRWDGDFLTARRLLDDGILGSPVRFESRFERFRPEPMGGWREAAAPEEGGGQLLDLGSHLVDQARLLLGHPVRLYAEIDRRRPTARVEDDVFIALEHPGGARSHLWMGSAAPLHGPRLRFSGARAGFACEGLDPQEAQLEAGRRPGAPGYGSRRAGRLAHAGGSREQPIEDGRYQDFYAGVSAWLGGTAPAPVAPEDSVAVLELLEAARRSATMNSVIELPGTAATLG